MPRGRKYSISKNTGISMTLWLCVLQVRKMSQPPLWHVQQHDSTGSSPTVCLDLALTRKTSVGIPAVSPNLSPSNNNLPGVLSRADTETQSDLIEYLSSCSSSWRRPRCCHDRNHGLGPRATTGCVSVCVCLSIRRLSVQEDQLDSVSLPHTHQSTSLTCRPPALWKVSLSH